MFDINNNENKLNEKKTYYFIAAMERQFEQSASESINAQWPTLAANGGAHERPLVKLLLTLVDNR